jgi:hypothetical protein
MRDTGETLDGPFWFFRHDGPSAAGMGVGFTLPCRLFAEVAVRRLNFAVRRETQVLPVHYYPAVTPRNTLPSDEKKTRDDRAPFTFAQMEHYADEAWGELSLNAAHRWRDFNANYFNGELRPVPIVLTFTQPYGRRLAFCLYNFDSEHRSSPVMASGRTITLNIPQVGKVLIADNASLLHEMVHQRLFERGEDGSHAGEGWRREIMRINLLLPGGQAIWAG